MERQLNTNYFESSPGNRSSSRLLGFIVVTYALLLSTSIIILGHIEGASIITTAAAAGTTFTTIAGPAMAFMFFKSGQGGKTEEVKAENKIEESVNQDK